MMHREKDSESRMHKLPICQVAELGDTTQPDTVAGATERCVTTAFPLGIQLRPLSSSLPPPVLQLVLKIHNKLRLLLLCRSDAGVNDLMY